MILSSSSLVRGPMERALRAHCSRLLAWESRFSPLATTFWRFFSIFLALSSLFTTAVSQGAADFISIDCGGTGFIDRDTKIEWSTDDRFLDSVTELARNSIALSATVSLDQKTAWKDSKATLVETAMVFIPREISPSKYCYVVQVKNATNYLVRAMFPNTNLTAKAPYEKESLSGYSTRFYFTVDSTFISTIELDPVKTRTVELVVTPLDEKMYICLVPLEDRSSMPAISSIELRPLPTELYRFGRENTSPDSTAGETSRSNTGLRTTYLMTVSRLNFGGDVLKPTIRYPIDEYDRLWYAADASDTTDESQFKRSNTTDSSFGNTNANVNFPVEVVQTAWEGLTVSDNISFIFNISEARSLRPIPTFYLNMYFFDVDPGINVTGDRNIDIYLKDDGPQILWGEDTTVPTYASLTWRNFGQTFSSGSPVFIITSNGTSARPPIINAAELLGEFEAETQRTTSVDDSTIREFSKNFRELKASFVVTIGDPCLPVPWNWLVCSIESPPRITQINITRIGAMGNISENFGNLSRLTVLDLSNNDFSGELPESLAEVKTLRELNLAHNLLDGDLPFFSEDSSLVNLEILSLRGNQFTGNLSPLFNALGSKSSISEIDLSNNHFSGSIPENIGNLTKLKYLDLSSNWLSGNVTLEILKLLKYSSQLETLSLRDNMFVGVVPAEIWSTNSSVKTVDLGNNKFHGIDLSVWCETMQGKTDFNAFEQKVDLSNNTIDSVELPCQGKFGDIVKPADINSWLSGSRGFILLGGSPYCKRIGKDNPDLVLRYICRSSEFEDFWTVNSSGADRNVIIAASVISGFLVLLMACILLFFLRRMWKRMRELHMIQEALAKEDVRPPFFKYEDLKTATGEFSEENELGKGAFGAVYKAVLADKSVVAVKLLYPTEQNIADFLKEMVLITGIKHRHLIQLKGCCVRDRKRLLVYEFAENRNLADALWGGEMTSRLNWDQRLKICVGVARGLSYLHEELQPKIIHRDIKAPNILLDRHWEPKIADFGLALPVQERSNYDSTQLATRIGGTLGYFSPEYATHGKLTEKLDVYSYGILVLEIVAGRKCIDLSLAPSAPDQIYLKDWAFQLYSEGKILNLAEREVLATGPIGEVLSVLKTALSCLHENPHKRPSMSQVVNMLSGSSPEDVAVDIVGQLRDQERMYQGLFDASSIRKGEDEQGNSSYDHRALLQSTLLQSTSTSSNNPHGFIQLTSTKPR